jgi:RNA polymerase sigma factor (sigma-70 family)
VDDGGSLEVVERQTREHTPSQDVSGVTLESLFRAHYAGLVRLAVTFGMSPPEAEESAQDAFVAWARSRPRVEVGRELAYLRRSTINASLVRHRKSRRAHLRSMTPDDDWIDTLDAAEDAGRRAVVRAAVRALPTQQRACVLLRYFEGLTEAETADTLGVAIGTVKMHMSRARESLRHHLEIADHG